MAKPFLACTAALVLALVAAPTVNAQSSLAAKLANERLAEIQPGTYQAGDNTEFTLIRDQLHYLLRFAGNPEVFVLYMDRASLGGRVLKYDTGETVLQVAGWGGMTLYTDEKPGGIPAIRLADATTPTLADIPPEGVEMAASEAAEQLAATRHLALNFRMDWTALADNALLRAWSYDALENAVHGIDRFAATNAGRRALMANVNLVMVATSNKPTLRLKGKELIVTFDPNNGFAGRASSRAISHALGTIFKIKTKAN